MQRFLIMLLMVAPAWAAAQSREHVFLSAENLKDTNTVKFLDSLSFAYSNTHPDTGLMYANLALNLSKQLNWRKGIALANAGLGVNYRVKGDYERALYHNGHALSLYQKLNDKKGAAALLSNIASVYRLQGDYTRALDYFLKALADMETLGDRKSQAIIKGQIGTIYKDQNDYNHAQDYYSDALRINKELPDKAGIARELGNLGIVYNAQGLYSKALENHAAALKANSLLDNKFGMQVNMANMAIAYQHLGQLERALSYHLSALKISREIGNKNNIAINLGNAGETYLAIARKKQNKKERQQLLADAIEYLEQAVSLCRQIHFLAPTTEFIPRLTDAYAMSGNYKAAYENQQLYSAIKDSVFSGESKLRMASLEAKRKMDVKEKDIKLKQQQINIIELQLAKKRNMQILYLMGIVILVLVLGITVKSILSYKRSNRLLMRERQMHTDTIIDQHSKIAERNRILEEMAHKHSHDIRGYITTIIGLSELFNKENYADPDNKTIIDGVSQSVKSLDDVIREIIKNKGE